MGNINQNLKSVKSMIAFFKGELSDSDQMQMEKLLEDDSVFADSMDHLFDLWVQNPAIEQEIETIHSETFDSFQHYASSPRFSAKKLLPILLLGLIILAGLAWYFINSTRCQLSDIPKLAREASGGLYVESITPKSATPNKGHLFLAFQSYTNGEYEKAIAIFTQQIDSTLIPKAREEKIICLGISYLMTDQPNKALSVLDPNYSFSEKNKTLAVNWYRALTYLKLQETAKAVEILKNLALLENKYSEESKKILNCIE